MTAYEQQTKDAATIFNYRGLKPNAYPFSLLSPRHFPLNSSTGFGITVRSPVGPQSNFGYSEIDRLEKPNYVQKRQIRSFGGFFSN